MDRRTLANVSWYTRYHHLARPRAIGIASAVFTAVCVIIWIIAAIGQDRSRCISNRGYTGAVLYISLLFAGTEALIVGVLAKKLAKHSRDALGMQLEMIISAVVVLLGVIAYPLIVSGFGLDQYYPVVIIVAAFSIWAPSTIVPIRLMMVHRRRQKRLINEVQYSTLSELLAIPEACAAFSRFVASEFSSESLEFYLRAREFKLTGGFANKATVAATSEAEGDHIVVLPTTNAATATISIGNATVAATATNGKAQPKVVSPLVTALRHAYVLYNSFIPAGSPFEVNGFSLSLHRNTHTHTHTHTCTLL
jgi:hypothetical protein